ncbi:MAG: hypothetical protein IPJ81_00895 [Chitinophagaceae bacterium]|nr:hypothetical protein [Chitinophagaceae bacterium]
MENIVDSFLKDNNCDNYIHELYIDKLDPHNFQIILYQGKESLTKDENKGYNQKSLIVSKIKGVDFNIYSGVERYFSNFENDSSKNKIHWQMI